MSEKEHVFKYKGIYETKRHCRKFKRKVIEKEWENVTYSERSYFQTKYWKSIQSSVYSFFPLKLQFPSQSSEWKMKIIKNHSSVMGKLKPLLNLLNYSIIPKSRTGIAKGDGNEWNWSNLAIWKEFLGVQHLFHRGIFREITGKSIFFFHGRKLINMTYKRKHGHFKS